MTLRRLADFMEKAQKIKGKVKAAMYYPCAVLCVAAAILALIVGSIVVALFLPLVSFPIQPDNTGHRVGAGG